MPQGAPGGPQWLFYPWREGTAVRTPGWNALGLSLGSAADRNPGNVLSCSVPGPEPWLEWPNGSGVSLQPWMRRLWLPALCVSLVTLGSRCLGFPTRWAEIGLLTESARVLLRQGLAGARAPGKVVCHGFLQGWRGRRPRASTEPTRFLSPALPGSGSSVASLQGPTPGARSHE